MQSAKDRKRLREINHGRVLKCNKMLSITPETYFINKALIANKNNVSNV